METLEEDVVDAVIKTFDGLPLNFKPRIRNEGKQEWVPLSGIVILKGGTEPICVSLATGMKCLASFDVPLAKGIVLHDWHAEVLALRAFNYFLIRECHDLAKSPGSFSPVVRRREEQENSEQANFQPFTLREDLKLYMYCSEAPCGDASMELTMEAQEDATPWPEPARPTIEKTPEETGLHGRGYFSQLGIVRRKPSRSDALKSLSKSCSDKLALKQCTSLLSSPVSLLISPENVYLHSLILPSTQYCETACKRAFSTEGRMNALQGKTWKGSYAFRPFDIKTTDREFAFSKRSTAGVRTPSNLSAVYTWGLQERLINGVLQGRKQFHPQGASSLCKKSTWKAVAEVVGLLGIPSLKRTLSNSKYEDLKRDKLLRDRTKVKEEVRSDALKGWITNGGEKFTLSS
ncbi:MAG: hypothetical protein M1830_008301 [Pleopsidium flavum]|nr:MAG: hypothetical protein M1830_008301 [Pleopsidium flavum]